MPIGRGCFFRTTSALVAIAAVLTLGCQPSPVAERRLRMRTEGVRDTAGMWAASEQDRPSRLDRASAAVGTDWSRRERLSTQALENLEEWQARDWRRWRDRQRVYADELGRILWGHPERIEQRAIIMFY